MNFYGLTNLIAAATNTIIALFILIKGHRIKLCKIWGIFTLCVALYGWGAYKASGAGSYNSAFFWWQVSYIGVIMLPALFVDFVYSFLEIKRSFLVKIVYVICFLILAADIFSKPLFIGHVSLKFQSLKWFTPAWWVYPPGPLHIFHTLVLYLGLLTYAVIKLLHAYKNSNLLKRIQIRYFVIAMVLGFAGGGTSYLPCFNVNFYPLLNLTVPIYTFIIAYAIVRHQLMDIEVIIKKTLVFASLFTIVFGIFVGVTVLLQQFIGKSNNILGFAISSLVIIFTVRPLEIFLIKITDRYLFQKKYDYKHLIREFMDELKTMVLNTTDIAQSTVDFLNTSIRPITSAVFMYNKFTSQYDLIASSDFKDKDLKIMGSSELVKVLGDTGKILSLKGDNKLMSFQGRDRFAILGIELIIPLLIHKELIGFLCLAKKKSDEDYSSDDTEALSDLSGALSISLNNAQLFDERADAEKRALVGTIATGINHEVGNPLNIITIKLDTFRILAKEGLLAHKTKEEIIEEVDKITKVCLDSAQRIAEITKQVSEFAKPDKKLIFGKVNISEAIDETIAFLKHGMILDSGKIEKRITCEPAYVLADRGQLKQILFNLIKNASHAVDKERGKIIVSVDKNNSDEIAIKIIDNGRGMPKEVKDKVFTPFFTTKEPGKGTGLGLALVKIMIDRNSARIKVDSEEGKGTTFTLIFKGGLL